MTGEWVEAAQRQEVRERPRVNADAYSARVCLRELLASDEIACASGAHDVLSALVAERVGFDAVWASGFAISAAQGLPDLGLLSMTEHLRVAAAMALACRIPVLADCDTGFGGVLNVVHTVRSYEAAGVAGICIEDKTFPKRNSFLDTDQDLLPATEFAQRLGIAKAAQRDEDFVVVARTEALICGENVDDALERAALYADAGADAILVHSRDSEPTEVAAFLGGWDRDLPVIVVPTSYYSWTAGAAGRAGAALVVYANQALRASVHAMEDSLRRVLESGSSAAVEDEIADLDEVFRLTQVGEWLALEGRP